MPTRHVSMRRPRGCGRGGIDVTVSDAARRIITRPGRRCTARSRRVRRRRRGGRRAHAANGERGARAAHGDVGCSTGPETRSSRSPPRPTSPTRSGARCTRTSAPPAPTKCPICAMDLVPIAPPRAGEYRLDVTPQPAAKGRGAAGLTLRIRDPDTGRDVAMFAEAHQRLLHLFIIGRDLQYFAHEHPERTARGFAAGDARCRPAPTWSSRISFLAVAIRRWSIARS